MKPASSPPELRRLIEAVLPEVREHQRLMYDLRAALEEGNEPAALALARRLVGLPADVRKLP